MLLVRGFVEGFYFYFVSFVGLTAWTAGAYTMNYPWTPRLEVRDSYRTLWVLRFIFNFRDFMKSGYSTVNVDYLPFEVSELVSKGNLPT